MKANGALSLRGYTRLMSNYSYNDTPQVKLAENRDNLGTGATVKVAGRLIG